MGCCGGGHESHKDHGSSEQSQAQGKQTSWIVWIMLSIIIGVLLLSMFA